MFFFATFPVLPGNADIVSLQHGIDVEEYVFSCVTGDALDSIWMDHIVDKSLQKKMYSHLFQDFSDVLRTNFLIYNANDLHVPAFKPVKLSEISSLSDYMLVFGTPTFPVLKNRSKTTLITDALRIEVENTNFAPSHSEDEDLFLDLLPSFENWKKPDKFTLFAFIVLMGLILAWMVKE